MPAFSTQAKSVPKKIHTNDDVTKDLNNYNLLYNEINVKVNKKTS